ncbi:Hsp20/alpha crystallin family protein [Streptomyces sp. SAJ15]|uniref:Hsp20/alpha crystallin family protein n=1 Tax=Streptomyces sp. SAJ15 TaxID=2011095 RepID=UPI0011848ED4|nr:Hsp20/alpha crystallin family protein [Streptomyces sp. SAJ15]TVL91285.1 heat-shock protein Hsp20 [Streptomyces sp. SAJ15]
MTVPVHREGSTRRDLLREFQDLTDRMGRLWAAAVPGGGGLVSEHPWEPADDVEETDDSYVIELDLPGLRRDQITVEVLDSELAVHGEVKEKERVGVLRRQTRRIGQFDYRMSLPADADAEHISAELAHGVLTVRVPRTQRAKPRRIEITG